MVPSTWDPIVVTKYLVASHWYQVLVAKYLVPSTALLISSVMMVEPSTKIHIMLARLARQGATGAEAETSQEAAPPEHGVVDFVE